MLPDHSFEIESLAVRAVRLVQLLHLLLGHDAAFAAGMRALAHLD
jgi:hypothetical protein